MMDIEKLAREAGLAGESAPAEFFMRRLERFAALVAEEAAQLCDAEARDFGGVVAGPMATKRGKLVHEAMAAGSMTCAAAIRERFKA